MKRVVTFLIALMFMSSHVTALTNQTFFRPRSLSNDSGLEMPLHNFQLYHNLHREKDYVHPKERSIVNLQSTYFYNNSDSEEDLARYFLFNNKLELNVKYDGTGDIASEWFGITGAGGNFSSKFKIRPEREVYGSTINYHHDLSRLLKGLWHAIYIPIVHVEHDINFREFDTTGDADTGEYTTIRRFFDGGPFVDPLGSLDTNPPPMLYGKFSPVKQGKTGVDDMQWKLGWNFFRGEKFHLGMYGDFLIPLGTRSSVEYIFEPMVGGVHWGLGGGANLDWEILNSGRSKLSLQLDAKYRYLFSDVERRSLNLKNNGPWSRYLRVITEANPDLPVPAINFLTQDVSVRPKSTVDVFTALHYRYSSFHFEGGYNFWWRDSESVKLDGAFDENQVGIFDIAGGASSTSHLAKISETATTAPAADAAFTTIKTSDLDLDSAAHKSALSHKVFGGLSITGKFCDSPSMVGFGGSYEFADRNTALDQWAVWLKTAISF